MVPLSECTDLMLWEQGLVSLHELSSDGGVMGGPESRFCFMRDHDFSIRKTEVDDAGPLDAGEQYEVCSRCHHVRPAPFLLIDGVEVSRRPLPAPIEPMPIAWPAVKRLALPDASTS